MKEEITMDMKIYRMLRLRKGKGYRCKLKVCWGVLVRILVYQAEAEKVLRSDSLQE